MLVLVMLLLAWTMLTLLAVVLWWQYRLRQPCVDANGAEGDDP